MEKLKGYLSTHLVPKTQVLLVWGLFVPWVHIYLQVHPHLDNLFPHCCVIYCWASLHSHHTIKPLPKSKKIQAKSFLQLCCNSLLSALPMMLGFCYSLNQMLQFLCLSCLKVFNSSDTLSLICVHLLVYIVTGAFCMSLQSVNFFVK